MYKRYQTILRMSSAALLPALRTNPLGRRRQDSPAASGPPVSASRKACLARRLLGLQQMQLRAGCVCDVCVSVHKLFNTLCLFRFHHSSACVWWFISVMCHLDNSSSSKQLLANSLHSRMVRERNDVTAACLWFSDVLWHILWQLKTNHWISSLKSCISTWSQMKCKSRWWQ